MKKVIALVVVVIMFPVIAHAWMFNENPDKYPSIGLNYYRKDIKGGFSMTTFNSHFNIDDVVEHLSQDVVADIKLPIADNVTFSLGGGYSMLDIDARDTTVSSIGGFLYEVNYPTKSNLTGYNLTAGIRIYIK